MSLKVIDKSIIESTIEKAKISPRKRTNLNFHAQYEDPINRLLNAMEPGTYVRPHKHENPDKREIFLILTGSMAAITFEEQGRVTGHVILSAKKANFGIEIPEKVWHTVIPLETGSVVYEIKDGPYAPINDKNFATWAPAEGSPECAAYMEKLFKELGF
jgi:cupin fold WbuC family metalloprotein